MINKIKKIIKTYKENKKWKLLFAICALIICITQVQQTYAKYLDTKEGDTNFTVAKWKIL